MQAPFGSCVETVGSVTVSVRVVGDSVTVSVWIVCDSVVVCVVSVLVGSALPFPVGLDSDPDESPPTHPASGTKLIVVPVMNVRRFICVNTREVVYAFCWSGKQRHTKRDLLETNDDG